MNRKNKTWIQEVIAYWSERIYEGDVGVDWGDGTAENHCWRCGCKRALQRCHIVPRSLGGSDEPSNLIPLCSMCHDEAPNVVDPDEMWNWIKESHGSLNNVFWLEKAFEKADLKKEQVELMNSKRNDFIKIALNVLSKTSYHFGQRNGGAQMTLSTWVWVVKQTVRELDRTFWKP